MDPLRTEFDFPEKKRTIDFYPLRVWLSTLFFGPLLFVLANAFTIGTIFIAYIGLAGLFFVSSLIVTIPFLFIYWYLYDVLAGRQIKTRTVRLALAMIGCGMIFLTFMFFGVADFKDKEFSVLLCTYLAANLASTWLFKFSVEQHSPIARINKRLLKR